MSPPYLCAGLGMVAAGLVLDSVQYWAVFRSLPELFIMVTIIIIIIIIIIMIIIVQVPALIGLKGNLEMTLASRYC